MGGSETPLVPRGAQALPPTGQAGVAGDLCSVVTEGTL